MQNNEKIRRDFEKIFTSKLSKWLKYNAKRLGGEKNFGPVESKVSYEKRFNLKSGFKKHQIPNLLEIKKTVVTYKIPDFDRTLQKPWDLDCYSNSMPAIAIQWYERAVKKFYLIDPDDINNFIIAGNKSITEEDAKDMAFEIGELA